MIARLTRPVLFGLAAASALVLGTEARERTSDAAQDSRTIYVSVMNPGGQPIAGIPASEFAVQEDNQVREITEVKPATEPIYAVLMVDTTNTMRDYINDFRAGMTAFVNDILTASPQSQIALGELAGAGVIGVKFTSNRETLLAFIPKLAPKLNAGLVVNEGVLEAAKQFDKVESPRRLIVTINLEPAAENSTMAFGRIADEVRKAQAIVWGIAVQKPGQMDRNDGRNGLLEGLARFSGGVRPSIATGPAVEGVLKAAAANMLNQYAVTFARPAGAKPAEQTVVAVRREGVRASTLVWSPKR